MTYDGNGYFRAKVSMANSTIPIEGAVVRVRGADEENRFVEYSLLTDIDGITESIALIAPTVEYSLVPDPAEAPFANYTVEVSKIGFAKMHGTISIFDGKYSYENFDLLPQTTKEG